ncbi:alginate lyase family protein [Gramella sp. AN32]|nr:alginate lyase family protein [Gramella sp. AN32]
MYSFPYYIVGQEETSILRNIHSNYPGLEKVQRALDEKDQKSAKTAFLNYFQQKENLYIKVSAEDTQKLKKEFLQDAERSLATADEISNRYFLFRYPWDMEKTNIPFQFKKEIDWEANPFGDPEWTFMLNRHRYWQDLGKAYLLTGKEKYAKTFIKQVTHWITNNPISEKTKQSSWRRIEAGIRTENWIKSYEYFKGSKHITPEFLQMFLNSLAQHAEYLNEDFSKFSQTSNWGVLEFQGLFQIALFIPEFKQAETWRKNAIKNLARTAKYQILEDGTQWEQSPMYHNEVFHSFLNVVLLSQRKAIELPKIITKKTRAMAFANIAWQKPNYHQPLLGDSDDTDLRDLLTTAGIVFMNPTIKSRAFPEADYENEFLFDKQIKTASKNLEGQVPDFLSVFHENSGDLYSRSSWEEDAFYSSLHLKRLGGGHAHDDLLHFSLFAFGRDYLIDPGRFTYLDNKWRQYFKDSRSHNTLAVDGKPNSMYATAWSNVFDAKEEGVFTRTEKDFDYAEAINTAYMRLEDPVIIQRRMLYLKPDVWLLVDSFEAGKNHTYSQFFNFPNKKVIVGNNSVTTSYEEKNLVIQSLKPVNISLQDAWFSSEYNLKKESLKAEFSIEKEGFGSFISLLYFPERSIVSFKKIPVYNRQDKLLLDEEAEALKLSFPDKEYTLLVAHDASDELTHFFYVEGEALLGKVVLVEINDNTRKVIVLKP